MKARGRRREAARTTLSLGRRKWLVLSFVFTVAATGQVALTFGQTPSSNGSPQEHAQVEPGVEANLTITVRVYNYAVASAGTIATAEREATRILNAAGVELVWLSCPTSPAQYESNQATASRKCREFLGASEIVLRILPKSTPARTSLRDTMFGFADGSALASVFYGRVERLALGLDGEPSEIPVILGHAIAHEIGHLLLGEASHSPTGIMCGQWDRKYLQRALMGRQLFTSAQSQKLRAAILARN